MDTGIELPGDGPWQRFIIKYRGDSEPGRDTRQVQARLDRAAAAVAQGDAGGLRLSWLRRLGIGADVFKADRPLQRAAARRLMQALAADPDLEYLEVDGLMQAYPQPGGLPDAS
ncbi:hypothetical protein ACOPJQ_00570 [Luteimonas dalianensis]|uniref:hypothetical protein n=1 Tax=Luteimonas dalianensis TaxID=1148196 RepID=UPI003BF398AF